MSIMKILQGHINQETAYVVGDYPYGYTLRCKIRYWVEKANKGAKKGEMRAMIQTTNPRIEGREVWNKPKASIYSNIVYLYLDENNYTQIGHININDQADKFEFNRINVYPHLTPEQQKYFDILEKFSRKYSPNMWANWEAQQNARKTVELANV